MCPITGQPDFATIRISYMPDRRNVWSSSRSSFTSGRYRDEGTFHEAVTNRILDDLVAALAPRRMRVEGDFIVRGGIHTVVVAEHHRAARLSHCHESSE